MKFGRRYGPIGVRRWQLAMFASAMSRELRTASTRRRSKLSLPSILVMTCASSELVFY